MKVDLVDYRDYPSNLPGVNSISEIIGVIRNYLYNTNERFRSLKVDKKGKPIYESEEDRAAIRLLLLFHIENWKNQIEVLLSDTSLIHFKIDDSELIEHFDSVDQAKEVSPKLKAFKEFLYESRGINLRQYLAIRKWINHKHFDKDLMPSKHRLASDREAFSEVFDTGNEDFVVFTLKTILQFYVDKFSIFKMNFLPNNNNESIKCIQDAGKFKSGPFDPVSFLRKLLTAKYMSFLWVIRSSTEKVTSKLFPFSEWAISILKKFALGLKKKMAHNSPLK